MRVGELPKCGCRKTKNPRYCDASHYESREAIEAAQPVANQKRLAPVFMRFETNASDEVKIWNAAVDSLKAEKRHRTMNGLM
jgi:hypothetical protein